MSHLNKMLVVFILCILAMVLVFFLVINDNLLWIPIYLSVLAGQHWLYLGGRWTHKKHEKTIR